MFRTVVSSFLLAIFLTSGVAAQEITVNKSEWDQLSAQDQEAIKKILQDVSIVPDPNAESDVSQSELSALKDVPPGSADWLSKWWKKGKKYACEGACELGSAGAVTGCGVVSGGTAAVICGALVIKARSACKKKCG